MKDRIKIVVYVPRQDGDAIRRALGEAGAGNIGEYSFCSFSAEGVARYKASEDAHPYIGKPGALTTTTEERIEVTCDRDQAAALVTRIKRAHPYEEPAIDIYPLLTL